jgi:hypothetical protein
VGKVDICSIEHVSPALPLVKNEIEKLATHGSLLPVPLLPAQLKSSKASSVRDWLAGGGEMGALMLAAAEGDLRQDVQRFRECSTSR